MSTKYIGHLFQKNRSIGLQVMILYFDKMSLITVKNLSFSSGSSDFC